LLILPESPDFLKKYRLSGRKIIHIRSRRVKAAVIKTAAGPDRK